MVSVKKPKKNTEVAWTHFDGDVDYWVQGGRIEINLFVNSSFKVCGHVDIDLRKPYFQTGKRSRFSAICPVFIGITNIAVLHRRQKYIVSLFFRFERLL